MSRPSASSAATYAAVSSRQKEDGLQLISDLNIEEGMRVLDLGCGTGYLSNVLAQRVGPTGSVLAVDPDKERIEVARETYGGVDNLTFLIASSDSFPIDDSNPYDIVFSNYVIHWIANKESAMQRIYKSLRHGGHFGAVVSTKHNPLFDQMLQFMPQERRDRFYNTLHYEEESWYEECFSSCKFTVLSKSQFDAMADFENIDHLSEFGFGTTGGAFDGSKTTDPVGFEEFKKRFGNKPLHISISSALKMIVRK